jgi:hypothetical protein
VPTSPIKTDIDYLVSEAFHHLGARIKLAGAPSSNSPGLGLDDKITEAMKFRESLAKKSEAELYELVLEAKKRNSERKQQLLEETDATRFFHQPDAAADFEYWAKISYWRIDEAVSLSFGKDPRVVKWEGISSLIEVSPFVAKYAAKKELAERAKTANQITIVTLPSTFLAWAKRTKFEMPVELEAAVTALGIQVADWKSYYEQQVLIAKTLQEELSAAQTARGEDLKKFLETLREHGVERDALVQGYAEMLQVQKRHNAELQTRLDEIAGTKPTKIAKDLPPRERETVLKLILGMAMAFYGYDRQNLRNAAISQIKSDLELKGIKMDDGTIRKYLDEAKALWPFE